MPFFFIVPVWLFCVLCGIGLLFLSRLRRIGLYVIIVSTVGTLTSFLASTAVLYFGTRMGAGSNVKWFGIALMGVYLLAIGLGGVLGGIAGFFLTRFLAGRPKASP